MKEDFFKPGHYELLNHTSTMMEKLNSHDINGVRLHWIDQGSGYPVVFLPGALADYRIWSQQADEFSRHYRTIITNRRYQFPEKYPAGGMSSVSENCDDLLQLLNHLGLKKITLVGHSYGGYIALAFAEKYPEMVSKLVLEEPGVFSLITTNPNNPFKLLPLILKDPGAALSFLRTGLVGIKPTQKFLAKGQLTEAKLAITNGIIGHQVSLDQLHPIMRQGLEDNIETFEGDSRNAFDYPLSVEKIKKIKAPTLLLSSDKAPKWFGYISKQLNRLLPNSELVRIQSPTHWLHVDMPEVFNQKVIAFIKSDIATA